MTLGNPLLWNNEDVEKNAHWIEEEKSIESFKSAWFEGDDDDEQDKPTKKTAKRGRPPSNTKQPIEVDQPGTLKRKNSGSSSKKTNLSELYCVCRKPYDATRFMIACDLCDDWFHGECISIKEIESEFVDSYICHKCSKVTGRHISWKLKCSNPACNRPSRISSHLDHLSKYCSSTCGVQVARARLELLEIKRRSTTRANHLPSIPELAIAKLRHARVNSLADKQDRDRLVEIKKEKEDIKAAADILKRKSKFVELLVKQRPFMEDDEEIPCGFDSRLTWPHRMWGEDSHEPFDVCKRLKCIRHRQWQKISLIEIKQEKREQLDDLLRLERERNQIKTHMRKRRCHTDLIKEYLMYNDISI